MFGRIIIRVVPSTACQHQCSDSPTRGGNLRGRLTNKKRKMFFPRVDIDPQSLTTPLGHRIAATFVLLKEYLLWNWNVDFLITYFDLQKTS